MRKECYSVKLPALLRQHSVSALADSVSKLAGQSTEYGGLHMGASTRPTKMSLLAMENLKARTSPTG